MGRYRQHAPLVARAAPASSWVARSRGQETEGARAGSAGVIWPAWVQRCGSGSACECPPHDQLAGVQRDLQRATAAGGAALPPGTRAAMEGAFAADFSAVRVHTGPASDRVASGLGARALTTGRDIVFGPGGFRPHTPGGDRLLAHELAHVVQQAAGLPRAAVDGGATDPLEQAAEAAADQAVTSGRVAALAPAPAAQARHLPSSGAGVGRPLAYQLSHVVQRRSGATAIQRAPEPEHPLTTAAVLELSLARLEDIIASGSTSGALAAEEIRRYVLDALGGTSKYDAAKLREKALRLNDFLTANQSVFATLDAMDRKDDYLAGIAVPITEQVQAVQRKYAVALQLAWRADEDHEIFELAVQLADEAMAALPDFIVNQYLGPNGLEAEIAKIRPELDKLNKLRDQVNRAPLRGRVAEEIVWMHAPSRFRDTTRDKLMGMLSFARGEKAAKHDISIQLKAIKLLTEQALGVIYAMQVYEQLDAYVQQLDNWINKGIELIWKEVLANMRGYRDQVDGIIKTFEDDHQKSGLASSTGVNAGLNALTKLTDSPKFKKDVGAAEDRMETIAVIKLVGKIVALTALAAVGGAVAAEYAAAAAISMGAAEGGFVAGGAAFVADVLAFTKISRAGQQALFGNVEGSFASDFATNALMFGVLKLAQAGFTRVFKIFADPKVWKTAHGLGRAGAGLVSLQLFTEAQHMATHKGAMMGEEERARSIIQSVIMVVALEAGGFISEPIVRRLAMPALKVKFRARWDALGKSAAELNLRVTKLQRHELSHDEVIELLKSINGQWVLELKLLADAADPKVKAISDAELKAAVAKYQSAAAQLQLQLSRLNVEGPITAGGAVFKPLEAGVVEFANTASALNMLKKFYADRGGKFEPSKRVADAFEGRLPTGELTFYIPEGKVSKAPPDAARVAAARDAANAAVAIDPKAAAGLERLGDMFGKLRIDEILAKVPPGYMGAFLRMMADPVLTAGIGKVAGAEFFINMARSPDAIQFGRRYGIELLLNLSRRTTTMEALAGVLADVDARIQADPAGTKPFVDDLKAAKTPDELAKTLGKEKAKPPKKPVVRATKKSLPVERSRKEWTTVREEEKLEAEGHGQTLSEKELDLRADCELFFLDAKNGRFRRFGRESKLKFLDAFDAVAKESKMPQSWINAHRGYLSEALFNPQFGLPKEAFSGGKKVVGKIPAGAKATIPDYKIPHSTFTEYINQKSDLIDRGDKDGDVFEAGTAAAKRYLDKAKGTPASPGETPTPGEATNLRAGDRYSLDFVRDPGEATRKAMLDILFAKDSPVFRVKFGDVWYPNPGIK